MKKILIATILLALVLSGCGIEVKDVSNFKPKELSKEYLECFQSVGYWTGEECIVINNSIQKVKVYKQFISYISYEVLKDYKNLKKGTILIRNGEVNSPNDVWCIKVKEGNSFYEEFKCVPENKIKKEEYFKPII